MYCPCISNILYCCFTDKSHSVNIKMNNLYDLYLAYQGKRNIFQEVKEFQKQEFHSRNFQAVMEWLRDTVDLSNLAYQNKVTGNLTIETENDAVGIKARTRHLECYIYEWEWQKENVKPV